MTDGNVASKQEKESENLILNEISNPRAKFIADRLNRYIHKYKSKRDKNRLWTVLVRVFTILSGGTITVILGLKTSVGYEAQMSALALILSAGVTTMTSWDAFADYHWKWIRYRFILHRLFALRDDFKYYLKGGEELSNERLDKFYDQLQSIVKEFDEQYTEQRLQMGSGGSKNEQKRRSTDE